MNVASRIDLGQELLIVQLCRSMDRLSEEALTAIENDPAAPVIKEAARRQRLLRNEVYPAGRSPAAKHEGD